MFLLEVRIEGVRSCLEENQHCKSEHHHNEIHKPAVYRDSKHASLQRKNSIIIIKEYHWHTFSKNSIIIIKGTLILHPTDKIVIIIIIIPRSGVQQTLCLKIDSLPVVYRIIHCVYVISCHSFVELVHV